MDLDVVIIGGGGSGLWLLDELSRRGHGVLLLEPLELGKGQTVASQGIIHGGLKYLLGCLPTRAAREVRNMPALWRECLCGARKPDLRNTRIRAQFCHLWRTGEARSRFGMWAASWLLQVRPKTVRGSERPAVLAECPGAVARIDEPVIAPASLMADLFQQHRERILQVDLDRGLSLALGGPGQVCGIELKATEAGALAHQAAIHPRTVVLAAGAGNARLRTMAGLAAEVMQRRPLQMVMLRGALPELNGHCIEGSKTRVTITSDVDSAGRSVWQVGGQLAEEGARMEERALLKHARSELQAALPGVDLRQAEWAAYRVDRAEAATKRGLRPNTAQVLREGNVLTAWPTKLALVPQLAGMICDSLGSPQRAKPPDLAALAEWPRPQVALPPWEVPREWRVLM